LVIKNKLKIHMHFPNGIRGDILTPEFIDLMMEAGAVTMDLALETASPRLQKLIRKHVNIERLRDNVRYIIENYPQAILGVQIMHGFPTETEEEAQASLEFIKSFRWLPFGYMHVLKIYPNTNMARFAMEHGVTREDILRSMDLAYHELPYTLPFPENFTRQIQSRYLGDFFLDRERLINVLPNQMAMLTEDELVQKYNSYLPVDIKTFPELLKYMGVAREEIKGKFLPEGFGKVENFKEKVRSCFPEHRTEPRATRLLLLDLSQHFTHESHEMYHVVDPPLGLMYLLTHLHKTFGPRIKGKIKKSQVDFDNYEELKELLEDYKPDIIGIRTLNYYRNFFHKAISLIRQWGFAGPIIAGGPYATSSYDTMLQDMNIDLAVLEEGEITMAELVKLMMSNSNRLPGEEVLKNIPGIAYVGNKEKAVQRQKNREVLLLDKVEKELSGESEQNPVHRNRPGDLAYIIYTSGSTGTPKGVMVEHSNVVNQLTGLQRRFQLDASFNYLVLAAFTFDVSVMHMFLPLTTGAKFYIIGEEIKKDPLKLWQFIHEKNINLLNIVPAFMKAILENIEKKKIHFKYLLVGGDVFDPELYKQLVETFVAETIINIYGPTETTINAALYPCGEIGPGQQIPIGKPLMNYETYILDAELNPVPVGFAGELYISGSGVTRGYLNRVTLTSEKFLMNCNGKGGVMYRTGDNARWQVDGNIEFLGRTDHQVKVRGFRIELEEIEKRFREMEQIKEAVVLVKEDDAGDKHLCAYITSGKEVVIPELRDCLALELPDYMVPTHIIQVEKMPLKTSGKIDTRVLLESQVKISGVYAPPTDDIERKMAALWAGVLGMDKENIGINSSFFDLGGHSLKATILVSRIHKKLNVKVPLIELFRRPTIKKLAGFIKEAARERFVSIDPVEKREYYALSSAQQRLYILQQLDIEGIGYNTSQVMLLEGELDLERLKGNFTKMIQGHECLRTSFEMLGETPVQRIYDEVKFEIEYHDLEAGGDQKRVVNDFLKAFDLARVPLMRVGLVKLGPGRHVLMVDMHHIITDGVSHGILKRDFLGLYVKKALSPLKLQYKEYSQWQQQQEIQDTFQRQKEYWLAVFDGEIPVLNLPTDYTRPSVQSFAGRMFAFEVNREQTGALNEIAMTGGATLFMVLLALYNIFLSKISSQEDIVVGTTTAGRKHADLERVIGMFVNTLALRNYPTGEKTFPVLLAEVKDRTVQAFENQDCQFEDLVERLTVVRDVTRNPVFDVMFTLQNITDTPVEISGEMSPERMEGLSVRPYSHENRTSKFDLTLDANEVGGKLYFTWNYCTKLFRQETLERFTYYFKKVIASVVLDPGIRVSGIEILSEAEKAMILCEFNDTCTDYPREKTLHRLFKEQVERTPDHVVLVGQGAGRKTHGPAGPLEPCAVRCALTYKELDEKSGRLASALKAKGVKPGTTAAVMVQRSIEMMLGIFAVMKIGGAYLPIDPLYPRERIRYILEESRAATILTQGNLRKLIGKKSEVLELEDGDLYREDSHQPGIVGGPTDLLYVIYTSGSTGKPKGVMIEHRSMVNFIEGITGMIAFTGRDNILSLTTVSFDIFGLEALLPITRGSKIIIGTEEKQTDVEAAVRAMREEVVTILQVTPSRLSMLVEYEESAASLASLKYLLVGGEAFPAHLLEKTREIREGKIYNLFGPTETTIWSTVKEVTGGKSLNIGKPIANTGIYILDREGKAQPIGVSGELCISGDGLARGYINKGEMTAEKFTANLYEEGERLYHTGDIARWQPDGNIDFLGRQDDQVKVRGFRIELGEIESQLVTYPGIKEAVAVCKEDTGGDKYNCAYIVWEEAIEKTPDTAELNAYLSLTLPDYMSPSYYINIDKIPLTPNGKINRKALPAPEINAADAGKYIAPGNEVEEKLAVLWSEVLRVKKDIISMDANFFELGGHSLKATILAAKIHKELNVKLPLTQVFKTPTIRGLSQYTAGLTEDKYVPLKPAPKKEYYTASSAQRRLYVIQQMELTGKRYNLSIVVMLEGEVGTGRLEDIFRKMIERHESFRTSFEMMGDEPVQKIHKSVNFSIEFYDLENGIESGSGGSVEKEIIKNFVRAFDLSQAPLFRAGLIKIGKDRHIVMTDMHHIISDGTSLGLLAKEFMALSEGQELGPLKLQFKDYSEWKMGEKQKGKMKREEAYWLKEFAGKIPLLNLPTDYPRPELQSFEGDFLTFEIGPEETKVLKKMALEEEVTLYMMLLALFNVLFSKLSGQEDIILGGGTAGRETPELQDIIGMFINTLAMRNYPVGEKTFGEFLQEVRERTLAAFENQDYLYEDLVGKVVPKRDTSRNPIFDVGFNFGNLEIAGDIPEVQTTALKLYPYGYEPKISKFDINLIGMENYNRLVFTVEYCTKLFKEETIKRFMRYFQEVIACVIEKKDIKLEDIAISHDLLKAELSRSQEDIEGFSF
jgi:amino acid adenylation domain-containing protein